MSQIILESNIHHDEYTSKTSIFFDVPFSEKSRVVIDNNIDLPENWQIGLIYGPSGSGKSTLLKTFGDVDTVKWDNEKSLISNFYPVEFDKASKALCAVGLSTIPTWFRSFNVLSNGEQFRANLAKCLIEKKSIHLIDEYSSVIDRTVAKSASHSISKWIRKDVDKKVIFASCHDDIIEWLQPDWIYNPIDGKTILPRGCLRRPQIELKIFRAKYTAWDLFKQYHYLSSDLNKAAKCFVAFWNDIPVAFNATLSFPHPFVKNAWRGSRTVVLPDYQGLGIGSKLSDHIASMVLANNGRYFSKTIHPSMIEYRLKSLNWKETTHSRKSRNPSNKSMLARNWNATERFCYAFEYVGPVSTEVDANVFWEKC